MKKLEQAARQALGALEVATTPLAKDRQEVLRAITTLREALSGVQALSAAPGAFLKSVIALCSHRGYSPANIEAWDKDDKWIADLWRQAESMLAASPTPPAEQQAAPKAAPVTQQAGYAEVIECGNSYAKVKLKGEAFGSARVGDIFYTAPQQEAQDATVAAFEAVRKKLCTLPRYSFVLDDHGLVRRAPDRTGNWIEFDEAHALFDPVSVEAALAAQGGNK